jgi:peptidoglycan/LPS O-acetylase OafA/YrhL
MTVAATRPRYHALDALRGVSALFVCLFHFNIGGPVVSLPFIRGSWLFVDLFFVLSGFVIACTWSDRLTSLAQAGRFAVLRFGRVYPLHIVMLLLFLAAELAGLALASTNILQREAFDQQHSIIGWLASAALMHIFGLLPGLVWNVPSWSIAAEFWTYLLFAGLMLAAGRRAGPALAGMAIGSAGLLALLSPRGINVAHDLALWRCLYGFAVGALVWRWTVQGRTPHGGTAAEIAVMALVVAFVSHAEAARITLLAPLLFALVIHVFAAERGRISALLQRPWLQRLGLWSYSIYMVHSFVQSRLDDGFRLLAPLAARAGLIEPAASTIDLADRLAGNAPAAAVITLLMLALVIAAAALTYRLVELPGQRWAQAWAARLAGA